MKRSKMQIAAMVGGSLIVLMVALMFVGSLTAARPQNLGVTEGKLAPVPTSPNCVSTQTESLSQKMVPLSLEPGDSNAVSRLREIIAAIPDAVIIEESDDYLYAEFRSRIFRFVDDVEFLVDRDAGVVHFRSASRTGHSDFGVNKRRMEQIRAKFEARGRE